MKTGVMEFPPRDTRYLRRIMRSIASLIICLIGVQDMTSTLLPHHGWQFMMQPWPLMERQVHAQTFTVVVGFFLIMLSYGLARGKQQAWLITIILLVFSAFLHIRRGAPSAAIIALAIALALSLLRSIFQARSDPPSVRRGYVALVLGLGVVSLYTVGGLIVLTRDFRPWVERMGVIHTIMHIFDAAIDGSLHMVHTTPALFFTRALPMLCISAIIYGMFSIFRPVTAMLIANHTERAHVNELVHLYGHNSISYFALGEDKAYFFSTTRQAMISYVLQGSTAVVAGDPIGLEGEQFELIAQFVAFCRQQDWTITFWQTSNATINLYRKAGLRLLKIGEDAVVDLAGFTLKGGAMANVRTSAKRAEKEGLRILFYRGRVTEHVYLQQMEQISRHWLQQKGGSEMGFSMGRFEPDGDPEQLYALAVDLHDHVHAFVSFIPIYGRQGWGLDLMRRAEPCAPGTMELLLVRTIEYIKSTGAKMVSLGLAPLSNANEEQGTFLESGLEFLTRHFGDPKKNHSLFHFKKKFQPTWESRYLVYSDTLSLPKIGLALYSVHREDSLLRGFRQSLGAWQRNSLAARREQAVTEMVKA